MKFVRKNLYAVWMPWFAWYPVRVSHYLHTQTWPDTWQYVWWETVERKLRPARNKWADPVWEYRLPRKPDYDV